MNKEQKSWAIIGGGILGMTLALRLSKQNQQVTIFESGSVPGGLTSAWEMDGITWDRFYHVILMSDLNTRQLLGEIGLAEEINWVETKTGFFSQGKLHSMSNVLEFFKFPPINLIDKFRLGMTIFAASRIKNWRRLEKQYVENWLIKWSGNRVFEKIWLPLLKAKLGENYKETAATFIWATIQRMYAARKSGIKKEMFGYVSGGYSHINKTFAEHLLKSGVNFQLNSRVKEIRKTSDGLTEIILEDGKHEKFETVISTLPSKLSIDLVPSLKEEEKLAHQQIRYLGVVCPSVLLHKPISPYYVTNITDEGTPFTGIIEMTALVDRKEMKGLNLVYLPKYVLPDDKLFDQPDDQLRSYFLDPLFQMYPQLSAKDVVFFGVSKARIVFPLPVIDFSKKVPGFQTSLEGYYIVNSSQIVNGTLNVNETILLAERALKKIIDEQKS